MLLSTWLMVSIFAIASAQEQFFGDAAKNQVASNPTNVVFDAKRFIATQFAGPVVQAIDASFASTRPHDGFASGKEKVLAREREEEDWSREDWQNILPPDDPWEALLTKIKAWDESVTLDNGVSCRLKERSMEEWLNRPPPKGFSSREEYFLMKVERWEQTVVNPRRGQD
eukprot:s2876_g6.t1